MYMIDLSIAIDLYAQPGFSTHEFTILYNIMYNVWNMNNNAANPNMYHIWTYVE